MEGFKPNPQQERAITCPPGLPVKVVAGAGTGKTTVLTRRFVYLLKTTGVKPQNILALTFTNKAAEEMARRIAQLARQEGLVRRPSELTGLWIGTFHSFCGRILRENAFEAGLDPNFQILDELDARLVFHEVMDELFSLKLEAFEGFDPRECRHIDFTDTTTFYRHAFDFIIHLKERLISPEEFRRIAASGRVAFQGKVRKLLSHPLLNELPKRTREALLRRVERVEEQMELEREMAELIYHVYSAYQRRLAERDMLDFADLIFKAYELLSKNEPIRERYRSQFKYILIDEFQDTDEAQFELLKLLAADERMSNVMVVGDDKQSIYGWRNARVENVEDFRAEEWGGLSLDITKNYRSYGEILEVAHYAITRDPKFAARAAKLEPELKGFAGEPRVWIALAPDRRAEAEFVAERIEELQRDGFPLSGIAVLMRSVKPAKAYEDALRRRGIPYHTVGGIGFYDREEVKDVISFLRLIQNPHDDQAMVRALKSPSVALSDAAIYALRSIEPKTPLFEIISREEVVRRELGEEVARRTGRLRRVIRELRAIRGREPIYGLVKAILDLGGYILHMERAPEHERARMAANLQKLLYLAGRFEMRNPGGDLGEFIRYVQFSIEQEIGEAEAEVEAGEEMVRIMTVHQAKGLEFDVVFVVNAKERVFPVIPRAPRFMLDREDGLLLNVELNGGKPFKLAPFTGTGKAASAISEIYAEVGIKNHFEEEKRRQLEEERRIWYVALTRARERLYITSPSLPDEMSENNPPFILELLREFEGRPEICSVVHLT